MESHDLSAIWQENAEDWLAWARTPGHDVAFWEMNLPAMLDVMPSPGIGTVDIGCGEGRVGRVLAQRGHRVHGLDSSETLADAARTAGGYEEVVHGDATELPWPPEMFDLAVAFMCLMDMPDPARAIREIARVLVPGGRLCVLLTHPLDRPARSVEDYFAETEWDERVQENGLPMRFVGRARPLGYYTGALSDAGFVIEEIREPRPGVELIGRFPQLDPAATRPWTLLIRARLD